MSFLSRLFGLVGTVDDAISTLNESVSALEAVRDATRVTAYLKADNAAKLNDEATVHHTEADRAHRVAQAIKALVS